MIDNLRRRLRHFLFSWQAPAAVLVLLLLAVGIWAWPTRIDRVVSANGKHEWIAAQAPPQRQVLWEPALRLDTLFPEFQATGSFITPRLADNGATLYFSFRPEKGDADIYRSRFEAGRWGKPAPVSELNSEGDDIGPVVSRDGGELYFYSNRPGGQGGTDIYVARRTDNGGWSKPVNLGPDVNSPAQEYDPALSPDGLALFFSSNRTPQMANSDDTDKQKTWAASMRSQPGLGQYDLYLTRRPAGGGKWTTPTFLADLNTPTSNEGAPYPTRSGEFLYFASDRPVRPGEARNFDLFRARWVDGRFVDLENLGPSINTAANETEPGLSPEGFSIVFSSDREHDYGLYQCVAQEVFARSEWDTVRLQVLGQVWWKVLLVTFLLSALVIAMVYYRGWILDKATAARFVAASLMLHLLFLLFVALVPLASEIIEREEQLRLAEAPAQLFPSDMSRAQPAYEKVADLQELAAASTELNRQDVPAPELPDALPTPDMKMPVKVRELQPAQVVPEIITAPLPEPEPLKLARRAPTPKFAESTAAVPEIAPAPVKPAEPTVAAPALTMLRRPPTPVSEPTLTASSSNAAEVPFRAKSALKPLPDNPADPVSAAEVAPVLVGKRQPALVPRVLEKLPDVEVKTGATPAKPLQVTPAEASVTVARQDTADTVQRALTMTPKEGNAPPAVSVKGVEIEAQRVEAVTEVAALADPLRGTRMKKKPQLAAESELPNVVAPAPAPAQAQETAVAEANVSVPRSKTVVPSSDKLPTTDAMPATGPLATARKPAANLKIVENAAEVARPGLDPVIARLTRKQANPLDLAPGAKNVQAQMVYALRDLSQRKEIIEKLGGSQASEAAVEKGLAWLAAHQHPDGSWRLDAFHQNCKHPHCSGIASIHATAAGTGLSLLPFLGAGYSHKGGKYQDNVARALQWLVRNQRSDGALTPGDEHRPMYGHGIASIALCEAFGMTRDPGLREPAQKALNFIIAAQHQPTGGWRYTPNTPGDTSVLGWQVMALRSGELAGLTVPTKTWDGVRRWLAAVEAVPANSGQFGYMGRSPTPAMTAQGLLCLQLLGNTRTSPRVQAGANYLLGHPPRKDQVNSYYWYHASQVMYAMGGKHWQAWNEPMRDLLVATQITSGPLAGTWHPVDPRESTGGRICSTSLRLLVLEVYYRRLPLYRQLEE